MEEKPIEGEAVEDARTGEMIPRGSPPELRPGILAQININQVGTLDVEEDALKVLQEKLDPNDVQIRPDGLVYLPWTWYNKRLNRAFGILKWGLIPQGAPQIKEMGNETLVVWLHWLVVKGVPVSMAGGETSYRPSNYTMSYGDAMEGARSNSLARNCKNLGMAMELWDQEWVKNWKAEHAEQYTNDKNKKVWRLKGEKSPQKSREPATSPESAKNQEQKPTETGNASETTGVPEKTAPEPSEKVFTGKQALADTDLVKAIAEQVKSAGKKIVDVCQVLNDLEAGKKFTVPQIVAMVKGKEG